MKSVCMLSRRACDTNSRHSMTGIPTSKAPLALVPDVAVPRLDSTALSTNRPIFHHQYSNRGRILPNTQPMPFAKLWKRMRVDKSGSLQANTDRVSDNEPIELAIDSYMVVATW